MRRQSSLAVLALVFLLAGCASEQRPSESPSSSPSGKGGRGESSADHGFEAQTLVDETGLENEPAGPYDKRPTAVFDPGLDPGVSLDAGAWQLSLGNAGPSRPLAPEEVEERVRAHAAAVGWFEAYNTLGRPLSDGPRMLGAIRVMEGVHVFPYYPKRMVVGAACELPVLVLNFRSEPVGVRILSDPEGAAPDPVGLLVRPASGLVAHVAAGRTLMLSFEVVATTEGTGRLRVSARMEDGPETFWQTAVLEVGAPGGS